MLKKQIIAGFLLLSSLVLGSAQELNVKALSENDLYRGDSLAEEVIQTQNQLWEDISLALLLQDVKTSIENSGLSDLDVEVSDNSINILYRDIHFLPESAEATDDTKVKLKLLMHVLERFSQMGLLVEGHTARSPSAPNADGLQLSADRAHYVAQAIADAGVMPADKIQSAGRGFYDPIADNSTEEGRAKNRRVELSIVGSFDKEKQSDTLWWDFLSKDQEPGYLAFLVHYDDEKALRETLEASGINGLIYAQTSNGTIGMIDKTVSYSSSDVPTQESINHLQTLSRILLDIDKNASARVGGYGSSLPVSQIEERHFMTAYTLGAICGLDAKNILFGAKPYRLGRATADISSIKLIAGDGSEVKTEKKDLTYNTVVPNEIDSLSIEIEPVDPLAEITGMDSTSLTPEVGENVLSFKVTSTARPKRIEETYTLIINREPPVEVEKEEPAPEQESAPVEVVEKAPEPEPEPEPVPEPEPTPEPEILDTKTYIQPEFSLTPGLAIYSGYGSAGPSISFGANLLFYTLEEDQPQFKPLRAGLDGYYYHCKVSDLGVTRNSFGIGLSAGWAFYMEKVWGSAWYIPYAFVPKLTIGYSYISDTYYYEHGLYISPSLRTEFIFPSLPDYVFGIDLSCSSPTSLDNEDDTTFCFTLGLTAGWRGKFK